jgi:hypothetical protein
MLYTFLGQSAIFERRREKCSDNKNIRQQMDANEKREGALFKGGGLSLDCVFMLAFLRVGSKVKFALRRKLNLDQKIKYCRGKIN